MPPRDQLIKLIKRHYRAVARIEKGSYNNLTVALVKHYTAITALELTLARLDREAAKDPHHT